MPRLKHERPGFTYACPACDKAGQIYQRTGGGQPEDDSPFRCNACGVSFIYAIERPKRGHTDGQSTLPTGKVRRNYSRELEAFAPEQLGLSPIGVRGGMAD